MRIPCQNPYFDQTQAINQQRMQDSLNNFNFNINMNLYLNQMPIGTIPNFVHPNPMNYLDFQYQSMLMQMNPLQNFQHNQQQNPFSIVFPTYNPPPHSQQMQHPMQQPQQQQPEQV